ncbi:MAG: glycoside hydrolase family 32 protein [Bacteroidales bacterium]
MAMKLFLLTIMIGLYFQVFTQESKEYKGKYDEPFRPAFHFSPQTGWMNDPNGLVYYNNKYHLFYQYYPDDIVWGPMHWGHAESDDLIHWKHLPVALYPDSLGMIFSGSAVIDVDNTAGFGKNAMVAIFTLHNDNLLKSGLKNIQSQGIAFSLDEGETWIKYSGNPVLNNSGEPDFRDPKVFWNSDIKKWNMVLAVGERIKIFSSPDLKSWNFESDFKPENDGETLGVWECPDLFKIKVKNSNTEKWVMIINHGDKAPNGGSGGRYFVGHFDGKTFVKEQNAKWLDYGTDFYAGVTFSNVPDDKRILLVWMSNWQYAQKTPTKVWRSAMTLPRELELVKKDNSFYLTQKIVQQFNTITQTEFEMNKVQLPFFKKNADFINTEITFDMDKTQNIVIIFSNEKNESYSIKLKDNQLITDRTKSGIVDFSESFAKKVQIMPLDNQKINNFQIILDKSSVEILLNNGQFSMTNLIFPDEKYAFLKISSKDGKSIKNLKISLVNKIWN